MTTVHKTGEWNGIVEQQLKRDSGVIEGPVTSQRESASVRERNRIQGYKCVGISC